MGRCHREVEIGKVDDVIPIHTPDGIDPAFLSRSQSSYRDANAKKHKQTLTG